MDINSYRAVVRFVDRDPGDVRTYLAWQAPGGARFRVMGRFGLVRWSYALDELELVKA